MNNIAIIGSDSFIASKFILANQGKLSTKLFTRINSGKKDEIIKTDLFQISKNDFKNCDYILNFVAIVHQPKLKNKLLYEKINTKLPIYLAMEAKKAGVKHFIQMSTIAVYGKTTFIDINSKENPYSIYGISKYNADKALLNMQDENFKVTIIRPPMVYGGGKAPGNMMKLINISQKGIPMPFNGIHNKRDFININNLVKILYSIIENNIFGIAIPTDRKPVSTSEIVNFVKKYSQTKVRLIKFPRFILVILRKLKPDIYNKIFGSLEVVCSLPTNIYTPPFSVEDGIREMIISDSK